MEIGKARRDLLAGAIFVAFGVAFVSISLTYEIGTPVRMGSGYFPLVMGGILVLLGVLIVGKGLLAGSGEPIGIWPWRAIVLITVAVLLFGLTVRGLGLVPALAVTALVSAFASPRVGVVQAVVIAVGLTALCIVIFVFALQLRLDPFGAWLRF
ncbi:MAG TPA: tripartite tricarboxylate transporter TctB family protein [Candidatus Limnocylindria bacterium]|nr:tripartite tricarboxylate transporter TctB family protein [Candidatus Limnocylindria bacterium]